MMVAPDHPDIRRATNLMRDFPGQWGVAGGWAIDLFVAQQSRPHADIDLAVLRDDQHDLRRHLDGARVEKVVDGTLTPWLPDEDLQLPVHEIHATWPDAYHLEFLLNEQDRASQEWVFRRDPRLRRPLSAAFRGSGDVRYLAPEIVLLYKSKALSSKDNDDLRVASIGLRGEPRTWLVDALTTTMPGHPWANILARET
jgi:aminoglycoside-2''-adenylyltransferase